MKKVITLICALMATAAFAAAPEQTKTERELMADQRAAVEILVDSSEQKVVMAVDGLCCATCGIGVKKNVQKLKFVERKGVEMDIDNSMLIVTLKEAGVVDQVAMVTAVRKSGYEPVRFYQFADGGAQEVVIAQED